MEVTEEVKEEVTAENETKETESEETEEVAEEQEPVAEEESEEDGELVVSFGEDSPTQENVEDGPKWFRKAIKDKEAENKRLREELSKHKVTQPEETLGAKPTLEGCDYDSAVYEQELDKWYEKKRTVEAKQNRIKQEQEEQDRQWQEKLTSYEQRKSSLKVKPDIVEEAESIVRSLMDDIQFGCLLNYADAPEKLIVALGTNPEKAEALSDIKDYGQFIKAMAQLEGKMKETTKKPATNPEKVVVGTAPTSAGGDKTLEKLRAEAEKTGDYTKVIAYKRQLKNRS